MARATPCGAEPNPRTAFSPSPDGKPFWDDGDQFLTYSTPETRQTNDINAEEVPTPILASEMVNFDEKRPNDEEKYDRNPQSPNGTAWGQSSKRVNKETRKSAILSNDDTFRNPSIISTETASDKFKAELAKAAADRGYGNSYIENQRRAVQARYGKE